VRAPRIHLQTQRRIWHKPQWLCRTLTLVLTRRKRKPASRFLSHFCRSFCLILPRASCALLFRYIRNHHVRIDMRFNATRCVHAGRINLKPALRGFITGASNERGATNIGHRRDRLFGG